MIAFKVLVQRIITSVISVYLDDFYDFNGVRKLGKRKL